MKGVTCYHIWADRHSGYVAGKTATQASKVDGAALVPDPSVRTPLPRLSSDGQFHLDDTGGQYTLLGYLLPAIINHALIDDKRAASQLAAQIVGLTTGCALKSQAIDIAKTPAPCAVCVQYLYFAL